MGRVCLKIKINIKKRYILAPSVLGPNLKLPAHGKTLTKVFESVCLTLACAFAENECIN